MIRQLLPPLLVLLLMAGMLARQPLLVGTSLLALLAGGLGALWGRWGVRRLSYQRHLTPARVLPGQAVQMEVRVENDKALPLSWLVVQDEVPEAAQFARGRIAGHHLRRRATLVQVLALGWFQRVTRHYTLRLPRRGLYRFGPAILTLGDPFGFGEQTLRAAATDEVVVYPDLVPLPELDLPAARAGMARTRRGSLAEDPVRFRGVRPYQPGDSLRRVHWQATARLGQLQVKQFEPAVEEATCVVLEVRTHADAWEGVSAAWQEHAIAVAASLYARELAAGRRVALYANGYVMGRGPGPALAPTRDPAVLSVALEALGRLAELSFGPVEQVIRRATGRLAPGTTLAVVTCLHTAALWAALEGCRRQGFPVHVLWVGGRQPPAARPGIAITVLPPPPPTPPTEGGCVGEPL